jgi:hypothetical protein
VLDLVFVSATVALFAALALYVHACDGIAREGEPRDD